MTITSLAQPQFPRNSGTLTKDPKVRAFIGSLLEQDRQDAIDAADLKAAEAAQALRDLVASTYGEQADSLRDHINTMLDAEVPDIGESATTLEIIRMHDQTAAFFRRIAEEIKAGTFEIPPDDSITAGTIYTLARQAVEDRRDCFPDDAVEIWRGNHVRVRVYRSQERIILDAVNSDPTQAVRVRCGFFSYSNGWTWDLGVMPYTRWCNKVKRLAGAS